MCQKYICIYITKGSTQVAELKPVQLQDWNTLTGSISGLSARRGSVKGLFFNGQTAEVDFVKCTINNKSGGIIASNNSGTTQR